MALMDDGQRTKPLAITFVTGNPKKREEVMHVLAAGNDQLPFAVENRKLDLPEIQGEADDIIREKCRQAAEAAQGAVMCEDTLLCFNALHGLPGPYCKWFVAKLGLDGLYNLLAAYDDKSAHARCIFALCAGPGKPVHLFEGRTLGKIVPARGDNQFGWDPVFEPDESGGLTYAEMPKEAKNIISHRYRALAKLTDWLVLNADAFAAEISSRSP